MWLRQAILQAVGVTGLSAQLGSGLSIGGNFAFEKNADVMRVVAKNASAQVAAGSMAVGVANASLGLSVSAAGRVLEASGALSASLGDDIAASASIRLPCA
jgi:hypothetical protein